mmetsp:Transcript_7452/g.24539  ORF Transcript_7452/g.24539 Transcript_7452/m.24539 type:complete len:258 (-) Transcript_7452:879-1652(-)
MRAAMRARHAAWMRRACRSSALTTRAISSRTFCLASEARRASTRRHALWSRTAAPFAELTGSRRAESGSVRGPSACLSAIMNVWPTLAPTGEWGSKPRVRSGEGSRGVEVGRGEWRLGGAAKPGAAAGGMIARACLKARTSFNRPPPGAAAGGTIARACLKARTSSNRPPLGEAAGAAADSLEVKLRRGRRSEPSAGGMAGGDVFAESAAPRRRSRRASSAWPADSARWSGVQPSAVVPSTLAPLLMRSSAAARRPV